MNTRDYMADYRAAATVQARIIVAVSAVNALQALTKAMAVNVHDDTFDDLLDDAYDLAGNIFDMLEDPAEQFRGRV